jgi:hypothetical protein
MTDKTSREHSNAERREQPIERHPRPQDPTAVDHTRESDATTINNGGLGGGRPQGGARITPERAHNEQNSRDPVMPDDDATLNTKI